MKIQLCRIFILKNVRFRFLISKLKYDQLIDWLIFYKSCIYKYYFLSVCTKEGGCVRHPHNCQFMRHCNVILKTTRDLEKRVLNVDIRQKSSPNRNTTDPVLPIPYKNDMMFFIVAKTSEKEKYMFMCHLGEEKVTQYMAL